MSNLVKTLNSGFQFPPVTHSAWLYPYRWVQYLLASVVVLNKSVLCADARRVSSSGRSRGSRIAAGAIAGIVIAIVVALLLLCICACLCLRRRRRATGAGMQPLASGGYGTGRFGLGRFGRSGGNRAAAQNSAAPSMGQANKGPGTQGIAMPEPTHGGAHGHFNAGQQNYAPPSVPPPYQQA
ncbi:uncharacterized protein FOMMEDRAFT_159621 [Fomitiporia mediterranea MF3/22]|uniref:uncharacterized protein n=1 Tax=Fomitiporia mediterranea (strain MF3/22) TaxID=694068 RepID=UPI00044080FB|nr:uncharacterized protein FOMMEDRAFT_159621 [Fomitiporia mediterranea MF3/22]EJD00040.1 hypothetical protein FOMMEDRAFT_159621 [Fomitiporia mediterranea MF3/22]